MPCLALALAATSHAHTPIPTSTRAPAQVPSGASAPAAPNQNAGDDANAPWPVLLGLRVAQLEVALPVARQVTLVPDAATWLDEVSRWTRESRWPVLFEDDRFAPLFIRAFQPERVIRRSSIGPLPSAKAERESLAHAAVARAWNGDPTAGSLAALQQAKLMPPGVAIGSMDDPAWPAAVALAAGRGLPLLFVDGDFGAPNETLTAADFTRLDAAITEAIATTGLPFRSLGDAIDAVALCREVAAKARPNLAPEARIPVADGPGGTAADPLSTIDLLCRDAKGSRYAVAGWIVGTNERAAYMAMCSLFLERGSWWFLSGYASAAPWSTYAPDEAAKLLAAGGFTTKVTSGPQMSLSNWRKMLMGGFDADVLVMNSSGDPGWFSLHGNDRGEIHDVPFLSRPAALHLIHSWSLTRPADFYTVGGRLLDRGVYAYYGSVQEPFLAAFLPPLSLAQRVGGLGPFLVSSRMLEGDLDKPWRLTAIGDPLMLCIVPSKRTVPKAALPDANGDDIRAGVRERLARVKDATDEAAMLADLAAAMRDLRIIGADDIAAGLWELARSKGPAAAAAVAKDALPALFRLRQFDAFVAAFRSGFPPARDGAPAPLVGRQAEDALDMLWHLAGPRVGSLDLPLLEFLRRNLRGSDTSIDLSILLPAIDKAKGRAASDRIVSEEIERTANEGVKAKLSKLLRR